MPRRRPDDPPPRREQITNYIGVVDAEHLINSRRNDVGAKTKDLFTLLCRQPCTIQEIVKHFLDLGHLDPALTNRQHKLAIYSIIKRYYRFIKNKDGLWFVANSPADYALNFKKQKIERSQDNCHWLRNFLFTVLSDKDLTLGQLSTELSRSGLHDTGSWSRRDLNYRIHGIIMRNRDIFERRDVSDGKIKKHHTRWGLKPKAALPISNYEQQARALWRIMMSANQITGWRLIELQQAVSRPGSGFKTGPDTQALTVKRTLCTNYLKDERFIKLGHGRYRARPPRALKKPAEKSDWLKLVVSIAKDLGKKDRTIPDFESVRKGIVQYGHLYGYDTQALGDFLINQVAITYTQLFGSENAVNITPSFAHIHIDDEDEDEEVDESEQREIFWPED